MVIFVVSWKAGTFPHQAYRQRREASLSGSCIPDKGRTAKGWDVLRVNPPLIEDEKALDSPCGEGSRPEGRVNTASPGGAAQAEQMHPLVPTSRHLASGITWEETVNCVTGKAAG